MQWPGQGGAKRKSSLSREIVCHKNCSCVGNWNTLATATQRQQQHDNSNTTTTATTIKQSKCKRQSVAPTPRPQPTQKAKAKDNLLDVSLSLSLSEDAEGLLKAAKGGKGKQILAAFWLIANSTRSWLQIKQNAKRGNRVRCELIIFMSISNGIVDKVETDSLLSSKLNQLQFYFLFFFNTICFFFDLYEICRNYLDGIKYCPHQT